MNLTITDHPSTPAGSVQNGIVVGGEFTPSGPSGDVTAVSFVPVDDGDPALLLAEFAGRWAVHSARHRSNDQVTVSATDVQGVTSTRAFEAVPGAVIEFGFVSVTIA